MTQEDENQLRLLSRLHYVGALLAGVMPLGGILYGAIGVCMVRGRFPGAPPLPGQPFGWVGVGVGVLVFLIGVLAVSLNAVTARSLRNRKNHTLCVITAGLNCVHLPLGTLLGLFTLAVLCRPAVSAAFRPAAVSPEGPGPFVPTAPPPPPSAGSLGASG